MQSESFLIVGYKHSASALGGIGRLLPAARKGDKLVYVGGVETGFTVASASALRPQMDRIAIAAPAVDTGKKRSNVTWVKPELVAEINFRAWTGDGKLRHASFKGVRDEADARDIYRV